MNSLPEIIEIESKRRCNCVPKCKEFFRVDGFDVYCKKTLEQLAFNILNKVNGMNLMQGNHISNGWTTKMEQQLIEHIKKYGVQDGTYSKLGVLLNKSRTQVKNKVYHLEKQGRLTFKRVEIRKRASEASKLS